MDTITESVIEEELLPSIFSMVGAMITVTIASSMIPKAPKVINYEVYELEWLAPQPLYPDSEFDFELRIRNYGSDNLFNVALYLDGNPTGHVYTEYVGSGKTLSCGGSLTTPDEFGVYSMTARVTVGVEEKEFPVSTVYIASFSIENIHWKRSLPEGIRQPPPYINIGAPVGAMRPGITYHLSFQIRNNRSTRHEFKIKTYRLGESVIHVPFSLDPDELSRITSTIFNAPEPGIYPVTARVSIDDVLDFPQMHILLSNAIVATPPVDFIVEETTWDDIMPFDVNVLRSFEFDINNLGDRAATFDVDAYISPQNTSTEVFHVGTYRKVISADGSGTFAGSFITPLTFDRYDLLVRIVIDNVFEEWYVVSYIDVGKRIAIDGMGDLNDDGYVSLADADILGKYRYGYPISDISPLSEDEFLRRADMNGDGKISFVDIYLIRLVFIHGYNR